MRCLPGSVSNICECWAQGCEFEPYVAGDYLGKENSIQLFQHHVVSCMCLHHSRCVCICTGWLISIENLGRFI